MSRTGRAPEVRVPKAVRERSEEYDSESEKGQPQTENHEKGRQAQRREDIVTQKVKIAGKEVSAVLDTGEKPSVIDRKTLAQLGLSGHIQPARSSVLGFGQTPVPVLGRVS